MEVSVKKYKQRGQEFKVQAVQRILADEPISRLSRELEVRRCVLYRWRDAYRREGPNGLRSIGRPGWRTSTPNIDPERRRQTVEVRMVELEGVNTRCIEEPTDVDSIVDGPMPAKRHLSNNRRQSGR
jgi:transposase-like protein